MELTGNPFVDTGLAVIAAKAGCGSVGELTLEKMREVHGNGEWLARSVKDLKSTKIIFGINAIAANNKIEKELRVKYHSVLTTSFLDNIGKESINEYCECCGKNKCLDLNKIVQQSIVPLGYNKDRKYIGRDWFPLSGSLGSDAQALPAASRAPNLCASCLFAVQYLPLGSILMNGRLALFQSGGECG